VTTDNGWLTTFMNKLCLYFTNYACIAVTSLYEIMKINGRA